MDLSKVVCFCVVISTVCGAWEEDIISPRGLDLGAGFTVRLEDRNNTNSQSILDKHVLRMDYANYGVSVSRNAEKGAIEVELLRQDPVKGRGQKMGDMLLPAALGFKAAAITSMVIFAMKVLVVKAYMIAKLAMLVSSAIFIKKYILHEHRHEPTYVEIEHGPEHHPSFSSEQIGDAEGHEAANYVAYANYAPSASAQSQIVNYAVEASPISNLTGTGTQIVVPIASKRYDNKKPLKHPLYTIKKITVRTP
ncbi:hypothetical protein WA026_008520 [Henosepilachna vigintioctopunctata]|uniref:Uncharacterized protein n=1 Tax=Henosepilachna vigintioctopunctata TaxID=420089 RepID=A0AAW1UHP0_9CUCU